MARLLGILFLVVGLYGLLYLANPNALSEGINSKIQAIKQMARGYPNREHFRAAIFFHCGKLDMYPEY